VKIGVLADGPPANELRANGIKPIEMG
jgi:hypothetical protein